MTTLQHPLHAQQPLQQQPQYPQQQQPAAQGQYPAEIANFSLLAAREKRNARAPDYFGSFKINGVWYQVSTWISYARNSGEQYLSNSVRPCTPEEAQRHEDRESRFQRTAQQPHQTLQPGVMQQGWGTAPQTQAPVYPEVPGTSVAQGNNPF